MFKSLLKKLIIFSTFFLLLTFIHTDKNYSFADTCGDCLEEFCSNGYVIPQDGCSQCVFPDYPEEGCADIRTCGGVEVSCSVCLDEWCNDITPDGSCWYCAPDSCLHFPPDPTLDPQTWPGCDYANESDCTQICEGMYECKNVMCTTGSFPPGYYTECYNCVEDCNFPLDDDDPRCTDEVLPGRPGNDDMLRMFFDFMNSAFVPDAQLASVIYQILFPLGIFVGIIAIILAGYSYMSSQGNPERVKDANDKLTSAILGILFIVLSLVILRIIIKSLIDPSF